MSDSRESSIIKVLSDQGKSAVGAGVLIGKKWVLTCRHVVEAALPGAKKGDKIYLTFFRHESEGSVESYVHFLAKEEEEPDFAILELKDEAPQYTSIAKLVTKNFKGRNLEACGFPYGPYGEDGVWVQLNAMGYIGSFSVQIDIISKSGYKIIGGFSGTPVFDAKLDDVFGIVVTGDIDEEKFSGCFTPIDLILNICKKYPTVFKVFEFLDESLAPMIAVPTPPPHYFPRTEDLKKIKDLVLADDVKPAIAASAKKITALHGMGGMGKSVLAAAFARSREAREAFHDGIFWVTVGLNPSELDFIENMRLIGTKLGDKPENYSNQIEAEASLSNILSNKSCLIILDNVWEVSHVTPFRDALGSRCRLIITTRNENIVTSLGAQKHKIEKLRESEALRLLADWYETDVNLLPLEAKGVAGECGYLPLALSICGAMAKSGIPWSDILQALQEFDLEFIETQLPNYPDPNVGRALKVSIDFLSSEDSDAVLRYQELAVFPAGGPVPEAAIATLWAHTGNLIKRNSGKLLTKLKDRSLLSLDGEASNRLMFLHDLQFDYLRATAVNLTSLHNQLLEAYGKECGNKWISGPDDGYFFEHFAYHMKEAGRKDELRNLVSNPKWTYDKLKSHPISLIYDYYYSGLLYDVLWFIIPVVLKLLIETSAKEQK